VEHGQAAPLILALEKKTGADLIVIGKRAFDGRGDAARQRHASCPRGTATCWSFRIGRPPTASERRPAATRGLALPDATPVDVAAVLLSRIR
jgi:hypothetical protein